MQYLQEYIQYYILKLIVYAHLFWYVWSTVFVSTSVYLYIVSQDYIQKTPINTYCIRCWPHPCSGPEKHLPKMFHLYLTPELKKQHVTSFWELCTFPRCCTNSWCHMGPISCCGCILPETVTRESPPPVTCDQSIVQLFIFFLNDLYIIYHFILHKWVSK